MAKFQRIVSFAEALEWASTPGTTRASAPLAVPPATPVAVPLGDTGERAEKQDAARRAAQARDAQRH
jgi:hypothetical protein